MTSRVSAGMLAPSSFCWPNLGSGSPVCMYVCICVYACMCVCMYVCMYMCVCMYVCMYVCVYVCMYVYMYVCMYVYVCVYTCVCMSRDIHGLQLVATFSRPITTLPLIPS